MKFANTFLLSVNLAAAGVIIWLLARGPVPALTAGSWSYADLIAIILTALGVILSAVTLAVAIVAIWSYQNISRSAGSAAQRTARAQQRAYFESEDFQKMLGQLISEQMQNAERDRARRRIDLEPGAGQPNAPDAGNGEEAWAD
jgi:hypothetical protein